MASYYNDYRSKVILKLAATLTEIEKEKLTKGEKEKGQWVQRLLNGWRASRKKN
jgi:hypothetical protein